MVVGDLRLFMSVVVNLYNILSTSGQHLGVALFVRATVVRWRHLKEGPEYEDELSIRK